MTMTPTRGRPPDPLPPMRAVRAAMIAVTLSAAAAAAGQTLDPGAALAEAKAAFARGDYAGALAVVRTMRIRASSR